jgi:PIN domain nuclease of toxin-antitoxin system
VTHLLDTHALLWALTDPGRLGAAAAQAIRDPAVPIAVSAVSAWELSTKARLGKLPGVGPLLATYARSLARLGAAELPVTSEHALLAGALEWDHRDPFDRMLAAQAAVEGLTLITREAAFDRVGALRTVW